MEQVELGLNNTPTLPTQIKVPIAIMNETGLARHLTIRDPKQVVPKPLRDWMVTHLTYKRWFTEGEVVAVDVEDVVESKDPMVSTDDEIDPATGESSEDKPNDDSETAADTEESSESETDDVVDVDNPFAFDVENATVDELRDYAMQWNINLKGASLKADIQKRIRDVIGD